MNSDSIFISYARLDQDFVLQLAQALKDRGLLIWVDQWNIPPGADWDRAIDNAIRDCTRFLMVLSPAATASEYAGEVRGELRRAMDLNKEILPVLYQSCEIPRQLLHIEYMDFSSGLKEANVDLLARKLCGETTEVPPSDRMKFINGLQNVPEDARAFKHEVSKTAALEISKQLTDSQFNALRDLKVKRDRRDYGAIGIVRSLALERIGGPVWEATRTFETLVQFGFLSLSNDPRERNDPDPGYDYTSMFFVYTNLQRYLGIGETAVEEGAFGPEYWLSSRGQNWSA